MATTSVPQNPKNIRALCNWINSIPVLREFLFFLGFVFLTSLMTWPWVTRLRDAVADPGDPYMIAWSLWWNYHQTFTDPLNLFNANIFYPLTNTLAFSENEFGVALLFFPLFALGAKPLTVHSVATFLGFSFCGYGAFRLTRTLTGSSAAAVIAGIVFAFIPYRFHMLSHLHYLFSGWLPLQLEALILFARERTRKRALWLAVAFTMNALTCLTWSMLALVPSVLSTAFLIVRYQLQRDKKFWLRGGLAMGSALVVILPFILPYRYVSQQYGFSWTWETVVKNSPSAINWLVAENRHLLWKGFGEQFGANGYRLFPGLIPIFLGLSALVFGQASATTDSQKGRARSAWVALLDCLVVISLVGLILFTRASSIKVALSGVLSTDRLILVVAALVVFRLTLSYPLILRRVSGRSDLIDSIRSTKQEAVWIGLIWTTTGFFMSLGSNSWFFRVLYDLVYFFRSMREPSRAAMIACLGLAVLAGVGALKLIEMVARRWSLKIPLAVSLIAVVLLFELRAAPLGFVRGAVYPDKLTARLKVTPMRGGIVELPTGGGELPHLYMLRAADHGKPLVNASSSFVPTHSYEIGRLSREQPIPTKLFDMLEEVPVSYLTIHNSLIEPSQAAAYQAFLIKGVLSGRLRFINRFDGSNDLYAIAKNEPEAKSEADFPYDLSTTFDAKSNSVALVTHFKEWSQAVLRVKLALTGSLPRHSEFVREANEIAQGLTLVNESEFQRSLRSFVERAVEKKEFTSKYNSPDNRLFVEKILNNASLRDVVTDPDTLLIDPYVSRADLVLKIASHSSLVSKEANRSTVLLHYFAYLQRNPDDPPDGDMRGFNFWIDDLNRNRDPSKLMTAFQRSGEYLRLKERQ